MNNRRTKRVAWGRTARLAVAGFVVGLVGATASCEPDGPDAFNDEAADLICQIHSKCDEDVTRGIEIDIPGQETLDDGCFTKVWDDFNACGDNCEFKKGKARRCLRRLERMADSCEVLSLGPCRRVYSDCNAEHADSEGSCDLWDCSVGEGSERGAYWALGLVVLGFTRRRRGRSTARRSA